MSWKVCPKVYMIVFDFVLFPCDLSVWFDVFLPHVLLSTSVHHPGQARRLNHCVLSSSFPKSPSVTLWQTEIVSLACDYKNTAPVHIMFEWSPFRVWSIIGGLEVRPLSLLWHCLSNLLCFLSLLCVCLQCVITAALETCILTGHWRAGLMREMFACLLLNWALPWVSVVRCLVLSIFTHTGVVDLYQWQSKYCNMLPHFFPLQDFCMTSE